MNIFSLRQDERIHKQRTQWPDTVERCTTDSYFGLQSSPSVNGNDANGAAAGANHFGPQESFRQQWIKPNSQTMELSHNLVYSARCSPRLWKKKKSLMIVFKSVAIKPRLAPTWTWERVVRVWAEGGVGVVCVWKGGGGVGAYFLRVLISMGHLLLSQPQMFPEDMREKATGNDLAWALSPSRLIRVLDRLCSDSPRNEPKQAAHTSSRFPAVI